MDEKGAFLNKDLNMDTKDLSCANKMKRTCDKYHTLKVADNNVRDGFVQDIEDIIEDIDPCIHILKNRKIPRENQSLKKVIRLWKISFMST